MAWTLEYSGKDTIGDLTAVWNAGLPDEFRFSKSVNLTNEDSVADFLSEAGRSKVEKSAHIDIVTPLLEDITIRINK